MARAVGARALLVADIERGGVFASVLGTLALLSAEDRAMVRCFAINRFRGDRALFDDGVRLLQDRSGVPCLGVFPWESGIHLPDEDSLSDAAAAQPMPNIAIIRFPRISNTTDFRLLAGAVWVDRPVSQAFAFVVLPGTKSTLGDLAWLRSTGLADWLVAQHNAGATVIGICGGYQMLGDSISDPDGVDGVSGEGKGLGLIPARTVMAAEKSTVVRTARMANGAPFSCYEIHMGRTKVLAPLPAFAVLEDGTPEGVRSANVVGTYLHGALESPAVLAALFGFQVEASEEDSTFDELAGWLERHSEARVLADLLQPDR